MRKPNQETQPRPGLVLLWSTPGASTPGTPNAPTLQQVPGTSRRTSASAPVGAVELQALALSTPQQAALAEEVPWLEHHLQALGLEQQEALAVRSQAGRLQAVPASPGQATTAPCSTPNTTFALLTELQEAEQQQQQQKEVTQQGHGRAASKA